jgi:toxin-antitoxin system PIN domain toxin
LSLTTEAAWLLDVNALVALLSPFHIHHDPMHRWFVENSAAGWATCPIVENGAIRVISQPSFATGPYAPSEAALTLRDLYDANLRQHRFWADDISLADDSLFHIARIIGHKQVTDAYLLGLAAKHGARLVSFDRSLPWQAIRNGSAKLIETPLLQ